MFEQAPVVALLEGGNAVQASLQQQEERASAEGYILGGRALGYVRSLLTYPPETHNGERKMATWVAPLFRGASSWFVQLFFQQQGTQRVSPPTHLACIFPQSVLPYRGFMTTDVFAAHSAQATTRANVPQ